MNSGRLVTRFWRTAITLIQLHKVDIFLACLLASSGASASFFGASSIDPTVLSRQSDGTWFGADVGRVYDNMTEPGSNHYRTSVHPLFSIAALPPTIILNKLGVDRPVAVKIIIGCVAALLAGLFFGLLRITGIPRLDAVSYTMLGGTSAAATFWLVVPETYPFGALTIVIVLCFAAFTHYVRPHFMVTTFISAISLSMTITNWMAGIFATFINHGLKRTITISIYAFFLVTLIWGVQKCFIYSAQYFLAIGEEGQYTLPKESGGSLRVFLSCFIHTVVMPEFREISFDLPENLAHFADASIRDSGHYRSDQFPKLMATQPAWPFSTGAWGACGTLSWVTLLLLGVHALFTVHSHSKLRFVLVSTLSGQLVLHLLYGGETFLYSLHFLPLLILLCALTSLTRARIVGVALAIICMICFHLNNQIQFKRARQFYLENGSERHLVRCQMRRRPLDPWPRGEGHVVMADPGSSELSKAYYEPGGGFSPCPGSFGVSFWMSDAAGNLIATSDSIPLEALSQRFEHQSGARVPAIHCDTDFYRASWRAEGPGAWRLSVAQTGKGDSQLAIVIRSVGPAGGPIRSIENHEGKLLINHRWTLESSPSPAKIVIGDELDPGWVKRNAVAASWEGTRGWGYARLVFDERQHVDAAIEVTIEDLLFTPQVELPATGSASSLTVQLPDRRFAECLDAQVAHLLMGLVGRQTRPGEPVCYPIPWQRDGAVVLAALARSGQLAVSRELAMDFSEKDFFGGFGAEGDAPGLSIWALEEVALRLKDPDFDRRIWPHVHRKAEVILEMQNATAPIHKPLDYPTVFPEYRKRPDDATLIAWPAQDGLINGRADHRPRLLYITATSQNALICASNLAKRIGHSEDAQRWTSAAIKLRSAWEQGFDRPVLHRNHTFISALWPTWSASGRKHELEGFLQERWNKCRNKDGSFLAPPLWTYFELAEAHQWLLINRSDTVWTTLEWFWNHQDSRGFYSWWEGGPHDVAPSSYWEDFRGWVDPPHVTPHYWTAAEMLLLQIDMLAYLDRSAQQPTIVIASGIPDTWIGQTMSVQGLTIDGAELDWWWDGKAMTVRLSDESVSVQLGPAFPRDAPIKRISSRGSH